MGDKVNDKDLIWTENSKNELLRTPIATISETLSTASDGQKHKYIVIDCRDWVIVIPEHNGNFLMVKQWRHGEKALSTEFPGGVIDDGETPEQGARRELLEETGCTANKLTFLGKMNPNPAFMCNHVHVFVAEDLVQTGSRHLDSDEYLDSFEMPVEEVMKKAASKEMPHALMAAALSLYCQYKNSN